MNIMTKQQNFDLLKFDARAVANKSFDAIFGKPLIMNVMRGYVVEAMIALALEPEWTWCSKDYASWDFERSDGIRLEVKQSAFKQSWATPPDIKSKPSFDIKARTGRWENGIFVNNPGRAANLYVFAYHGVQDGSADHRDPEQWQFYVLATSELPDTQRIGIVSLQHKAEPVNVHRLAEKVALVATMCSTK